MPDTLFYNARLPLAEAETQHRGAVLVRDNRIHAVGPSRLIEADAPADARRIDLASRTLLPAFADPHIHLWKVGQLERAIVDLRNCDTFAKLRGELRASSQADWILARGVNEQRIQERRLPDRKLLDDWCGAHPTMLTRICGHIAAVNSAALRIAGITRATPNPPGGEIRRDESGEPDGVLTETAIDLIRDHLPEPTALQRREWITAACERKIRQGCASATDPGVDDALLRAYRAVDASRSTALRCHAMRLAPETAPVDGQPPAPPESTDRLTIDTAKFFLDGGLSGATAAISRPYRHTESTGVLRMTASEFAARVAPYERAGYSTAVHAIGDVAIDAALEAFESLPPTRLRRRIEHFGLPSKGAIVRAAAKNVVIVTQPRFLPELGSNFGVYLPKDFPITPYPFHSMLDAGLTVAFSSDAPVVVEDAPLAGIAAAASRRADNAIIGEHERIAVRAAIEAYTLGAAVAEGVAADRGTISAGKFADMVVLRRDPIETPVDEISAIDVDMTIIDGNIEHES